MTGFPGDWKGFLPPSGCFVGSLYIQKAFLAASRFMLVFIVRTPQMLRVTLVFYIAFHIPHPLSKEHIPHLTRSHHFIRKLHSRSLGKHFIQSLHPPSPAEAIHEFHLAPSPASSSHPVGVTEPKGGARARRGRLGRSRESLGHCEEEKDNLFSVTSSTGICESPKK